MKGPLRGGEVRSRVGKSVGGGLRVEGYEKSIRRTLVKGWGVSGFVGMGRRRGRGRGIGSGIGIGIGIAKGGGERVPWWILRAWHIYGGNGGVEDK